MAIQGSGQRVLRWHRTQLKAVVLAAAFGLAFSPVVISDDWGELHELVREGKILSLNDILNRLMESYVGQVVDVELEREDGIPVYEIEMLGPQGQIVEFELDATSGEIIGIEGRNIQEMLRK